MRFCLPLVLIAAAACGGPRESAYTRIDLATQPEGATCTVVRGSTVIGDVSAPGVIRVTPSSRDLELTCRLDGYAPTPATIVAEERADRAAVMLLAGGLGGLIGSAAAGGLHDYTKNVAITLIPARFPSAAARDEFFAPLAAKLLASHEARIERARGGCSPGDAAGCDLILAPHINRRDMELAKLNAARGSVAIDA